MVQSAFQSPEGDSLFFYIYAEATREASAMFQSPEGDSLFFYIRDKGAFPAS